VTRYFFHFEELAAVNLLFVKSKRRFGEGSLSKSMQQWGGTVSEHTFSIKSYFKPVLTRDRNQ